MTLSELRTQARDNKILYACAACWCLEAYLNAAYGYKRAGAGLAVVLLCVAVFAAYLPTKMPAMRDTTPWAWIKRAVLLPFIVLCVGVGQVAGWSTMGTMLADGQAEREDDATGRAVVKDSLQAKREEHAKIKGARSPAEVEAAIAAELAIFVKAAKQTVAAATKDCAEPGWAPNACTRVATLRKELAVAQRRVALEAEITGSAGKLATVKKVAEGTPDVDVLQKMTGADPKAITFWLSPVIVAVVGLLANFGFALVGMADTAAAPSVPAGRSFWEELPAQMRPAGPALMPPVSQAAPPAPHQTGDDGLRDRAPAPVLHGLGSANHASYAAPAYHGAPINIHLGAASGPPPGVAAPTPAAGSGSPTAAPPVPQAYHEPSQHQVHQAYGAALGPLTPAIVPVDRAPVKAALDKLLTFRAACVVDAPGEGVLVDDLYGRFQSWAQGRGLLSRELFAALFPEATGLPVVLLGGAAHVTGVALRPAPQLQAVG